MRLLSIQAARSFGCEVDTLTLSVQQKALAEERIKEAGLEGRIRVHLMDYRELPPDFEKAFDAFVSVEMIEVSIKFSINPPGSCAFMNKVLIHASSIRAEMKSTACGAEGTSHFLRATVLAHCHDSDNLLVIFHSITAHTSAL